MWPHRRQPTRLPHPWDSPGKNAGVGCHFLLQCMKVKSESEVAQSCPTLSDPMDWTKLKLSLFWHIYINHSQNRIWFSSVEFSHSVASDSLWPYELQHIRPPCPSPTPRVHSNSCPLSQWCHPAISSSIVPFSSCPQSLPASESFPMSQLFVWGGQSTGVSASASFLPKKSQGWSPSEWTGF